MSWVGLAILSSVAAAPQGEPAAPRLDGVWVLNADESDDAREEFQEAMRDRFRGRRGGRPGRGPGAGGLPGGGLPGGGLPGGGGPGGGGPPGSGPGGEGRHGPGASPESYERLEITSAPEEVQIAYGDDLRIFRPDGREVDRRTERGRTKVKAHWDEGRLVVETDGEQLDSREVFELEAGSSRLVLTQVIDGRMGQVKIRRVYDRGEAGAADPGSPSNDR